MGADDRRSQSQEKVSLLWQILLNATAFGLETSVGFFQIYSVLFLRYMGVPVSLLSLAGAMTGAFCITVMPVIGYLSDKGNNPKMRKWLALLFGKGLILMAITMFFAAAILNFQKLTEQQEYLNQQQENGSIDLQNSTMTQKNSSNTSGKTLLYTSPLPHHSHSYSTPSTSLWTTDAPQAWEIPVTAVLAILCVFFLNIGYDSCASISKAFILVCVPTNQQSGILITGTVLQSLSGTIFSALGVLDLPRFLGPLFGVDGVSISFLLYVAYMFVCVVAGFTITSVASRQVDRMLRRCKKTADKRNLESNNSENYEMSAHKNPSAFVSESKVTSSNFNEGTINDVEGGENNPGRPDEILNYSSTPETPYISQSDTQNGQSRSSVEPNTSDVVIENQSTSPQEEGDMKFRLNKKLIVLCLGHFFGLGGILSVMDYLPNALTVGIYQGDPTAIPGTEKYALFQKGLKMTALGNLLFYVTYLMMSLGTKRVLRHIGIETLQVFLSSSFLVTFTIFLIFQHEALYFVNAIVFGPYRTCVFTIPYLLAARYNLENQVNPQGPAKNLGKIMALIGIILPIHYFILSSFMGPVMDKTNDVWFPLRYSFANFSLSLLFYCLLLFWRRHEKTH